MSTILDTLKHQIARTDALPASEIERIAKACTALNVESAPSLDDENFPLYRNHAMECLRCTAYVINLYVRTQAMDIEMDSLH